MPLDFLSFMILCTVCLFLEMSNKVNQSVNQSGIFNVAYY